MAKGGMAMSAGKGYKGGGKTEVKSSRKKADLSLPPKTVKPVQTVKPPVRPKPVTPPVQPPPRPVARPTPVQPPPVRPETVTPPVQPPQRPAPKPVDETEYSKLRNASRIKAAMRDNPLPKIGNDLVKMNKGGKVRGCGIARRGLTKGKMR
jgi:hypothetical protein